MGEVRLQFVSLNIKLEFIHFKFLHYLVTFYSTFGRVLLFENLYCTDQGWC